MLTSSQINQVIKNKGYLILDGGLATELEAQGHNLNTKLWSAELLKENPEAIKKVHRAYLEAGSDCIITASYQASFHGFQEQGFSRSEAEKLMKKSVTLALEARDEFWQTSNTKDRIKPLVAASIGPYGAYLANGAEYTGNYGISKTELRNFHSKRLQVLVEMNPDLLACETIPSLEEADVLGELLNQFPEAIAWVSFSCKDSKHINDGTPIRKCAELLTNNNQVFSIGINCTAPRFIASLITEIKNAAPEKLIAVYPNSGEIYDGMEKKWLGTRDPAAFGKAVREWYKVGASLIGGCCRTKPAHIQAIHNSLEK